MFEPQPFDRDKHVYRCDEFSELLKDAVRFFHGTPVCTFPPEERFTGAGVYALLMIFEGPVEAMIASVEASLIAMHRPLWNSVIDGFGNHNPGNKRFTGMVTQWDTLHPGRTWVKQMTGETPDIKMLNRRIKDYFVGVR